MKIKYLPQIPKHLLAFLCYICYFIILSKLHIFTKEVGDLPNCLDIMIIDIDRRP